MADSFSSSIVRLLAGCVKKDILKPEILVSRFRAWISIYKGKSINSLHTISDLV